MAALNAAWTRLTPDEPGRPDLRRERAMRLKNSGVGAGVHAQSEPRSHHWRVSPSERAVETIARGTLGRALAPGQREALGSLFHYGFGATAGAIYGVAAERYRAITAGRGLLYATLVWLLADELAVPAMGLAESPLKTPPRRHAYALAGHIAYGLMLEQVRRVVRRRV